jgi:hypothetical protein
MFSAAGVGADLALTVLARLFDRLAAALSKTVAKGSGV